jgi:hypothetical protein
VDWLAATRDVIVIIVALVSLAANVLLIFVGLRLWNLAKVLKSEVDPVLSSAQRTTSTVRETSTLLGDSVIVPVARLAAISAAAQTLVRSLTTISRGGRRQ